LYNSAGKPPKSCQVAGMGVLMTAGARAIQCGDMMTTPRRPAPACCFRRWPSLVRAGPLSPASIANSGAPWEMKRAGRDGLGMAALLEAEPCT
jgi:hypothetical protein